MMPRARWGVFALALPFVHPLPAAAQIQASEHAIVAQTVDGTTITLEYSRPQARGRDLFGSLMPWGVVWTPGANWATTLEVDADIKLNSTEVPAGKYSMWAIPRPERFTVTLNPEPRIFHFMKPDSTSEQIHVSAEPKEGPHVEMLTWSFPEVTGDAATLRLQWGTTTLDMQVVVPPSRSVTLSDEQRSRYIGQYEVAITEGVGWPTSSVLEVYEQDSSLRGRFPFPMHPGDELDSTWCPQVGTCSIRAFSTTASYSTSKWASSSTSARCLTTGPSR